MLEIIALELLVLFLGMWVLIRSLIHIVGRMDKLTQAILDWKEEADRERIEKWKKERELRALDKEIEFFSRF